MNLKSALLCISTLWAGTLSAQTPWHIKGVLSEVCSCSIPCTCNFGQNPSPNGFCWALVATTIEHGNYGKTKLDGLKFGVAVGEKGFTIVVDAKATPEQSEAMKKLGEELWWKAMQANGVRAKLDVPQGLGIVGCISAPIEHTFDGRSNHVRLGDMGGFDTEFLIGIDGKTPITLGNNWSINFSKPNVKGKAVKARFSDKFGNAVEFDGTNANHGTIDWN